MIFTADGRIVYTIDIDGEARAIKTAEDAGKKAGGRLEEVMTGAARRIGEAFVNMSARAARSIVDISKAGIEFNAKVEQYTVALTTLLGTEEEAARVMAQIREDAARTPFDVDSLTSANQMLISAGVSADTARKDILNLANAISATGGGSAELSRMAANLQQIKNTGKATAMDIRQFANAGINIYGLLADSMGVTVEEAAKLDVSYDSLTAALEKAAAAGGKYAGSLEAQSRTFNGRISTLKDNATQLAGALTRDLFSTLSGDALPLLQDMVAELLEAAEKGGVKGALDAAKNILKRLLDQFLAGLPQMLDVGVKLTSELISGIGKAIPSVMGAATDIVITILDRLTASENIDAVISAGMDLLTGVVDGLLSAIPKLKDALPRIITSLINGLWEAAPRVLTTGAELIVELGRGLISAIPELLRQIPVIAKELVGKFASEGPQLIKCGFSALSDVITGLISAIPELVAAVPEVIDALLAAFFSTDWISVGVDIMSAVGDGILSTIDALGNSVNSAMNNLFNPSGQTPTSFISDFVTEQWRRAGVSEGTIERFQQRLSGKDWSGGGFGGSREAWERSAPTRGVAAGFSATINVPVVLNGREIARATARPMGEQMAWMEV